jgi:hypothetical protein
VPVRDPRLVRLPATADGRGIDRRGRASGARADGAAGPALRRARDTRGAAGSGDLLQLQASVGNRAVAQLLAQPSARSGELRGGDRNGLPEPLRSGIERLSGISMDDVRVHRGSPRPARVNARAYTRGTDIHVAPGEDRHLAHEAWHVVQQKQGRVRPTVQAGDFAINADPGLEHEAHAMGARATMAWQGTGAARAPRRVAHGGQPVVQRLVLKDGVLKSSFDASMIVDKETAVITAAATKDDFTGGHAALYLEIVDADDLAKTYLIDLRVTSDTNTIVINVKQLQTEYKPGMLASLRYSRSIEGNLILPAKYQAYMIPRQKGFLAIPKARGLAADAQSGKLVYNAMGNTGWNLMGYVKSFFAVQPEYINCAEFAAKVLQVAGVEVSSGLLGMPSTIAVTDPRTKQQKYEDAKVNK